MQNIPAIAIQSVSFSYSAEPVLTKVNLQVETGEYIALIGPNGGGKSTLLRLLLGVLRPTAGSINLFGAPPARMRSQIGYVPQFAALRPDFPATVLEMVLMGGAVPSAFGGSWGKAKPDTDTAMQYLSTLGLADLAHKQVGGLSGGQRQRALVARALMGRPKQANSPFLLLLDEPTANIDPQGKFCFYEFLGQLRGSVTIVVVSHDLLLASPFFNKIGFVCRTLTCLPGNTLNAEVLTQLYGQHKHPCPVGDWQHKAGQMHQEHDDCTHPACSTGTCCEDVPEE